MEAQSRTKAVIELQLEIKKRIEREFNKLDKSKWLWKQVKEVYLYQIHFDDKSTNTIYHPNLNSLGEIEKYLHEYDVFNQQNQNEQITNIFTNYLDRFEKENSYWVGEPQSPIYYLGKSEQPLFIPIIEFNKGINKIINPFFTEYKIEWKKLWSSVSYDEIGRRAAEGSNRTLYLIISDLHIISSTPYEGAECQGNLIIIDTTPDISLREKVHISEHKRIRKLLETTNSDFILLVDSDDKAYGFKICNSKFDSRHMGLHIDFKGRSSWSCKINSFPMFSFENMQVNLPIENNNEMEEFESKLEIFELNEENTQLLISFLVEAQKQKHGTMLVILDEKEAKSEAQRLAQSSTSIIPSSIEPSSILRMSSIDGAIIMDTNGICYAFGVILDGKSIKGDPSRGARYNSSLRYLKQLEEKNTRCLIVIVSEDGYTTIKSTEEIKTFN